ncbi:MAG: biosynthetic arginine decarboxylase [Labilithrix sp.]|nr:biosynthetic arginine decarboxylase [Labilithrix sp.]MBX3219083.1 biosynthetic arginine decarboxylase [Labilithrix sp.]
MVDGITEQDSWTVDDARDLYMIDRWSGGYFDVSPDGKMTVAPLQARGRRVAIRDVLEQAMRDEGLKTPLVIRFQDILHHRVRVLNEAFAKAIAENKYRGAYRGVFPIKVNQLREVVDEILEAGRPFHYGIEVGSKPEMYAGLAVHTDNESLIVCNGYKDDAFIRTALIGRKLGKKVILIAEKLSEVRAIVRIAKEMGVEPEIGVRVRLVARGAGKWAESTGEHAKFGLSTSEILEAAAILREAGMPQAFKLVHFHIGSQVPDILIIKRAVREAARYYAKLRRLGHPIEYIDVGGGLAIDYDGSRTPTDASMNYSVEEYARDIVANIADVCEEERVPHPHIVSESGRAIVAQHCVLVVEAFGAIERANTTQSLAPPPSEEHKLIVTLREVNARLNESNLLESWHDLLEVKEEAQKMFELGFLELDVKASLETLFWQIAGRIRQATKKIDAAELPDELAALEPKFGTQQICNFSVFQSLLDHWAFGALFPIVPIHRLDERPGLLSTLVDITCDSDGKVGKFIDRTEASRDTLPLHSRNDEPYYIGVFLTGAYQDIMGDIHNLFGRVNEVHVFLDDDEECGYYLEETIEGNSIAEVLKMTQYDTRELATRVKAQVDAAIKQDRLKPTEGMRLLAEFERGLKDQTYLSW